MSLFFADGKKWLENKAKKIEKFLENKPDKKEGYRGIMGPIDSIDSMNTSELNQTSTISNNLAQGVSDYNTKYNALSSDTTAYLGMTAQYGSDKNYNIFINAPLDNGNITASPYSGGKCIANGTSYSALAGLIDASTKGFDTAYPSDKFPNTPAGTTLAMNACKLWAADSQVPSSNNPANTYFALTKDANNKFKCYTGNSLTNSTPTPYVIKKVAYKVASSNDASRGGLFYDGTVGVYNETVSLAGPADTSNPNNVQTPFASPFTKYTKCDRMSGGSVNPTTINATLGVNCSNFKGTPVKIRYIYVNTNKKSNNYGQDDGWIQISKLFVFAFTSNGNSTVVTDITKNNKLVAHSGNGENYSNQTDSSYSYSGFNLYSPLNLNVDLTRNTSMYHSATNNINEWWSVDLGDEYSVFKITYINRWDCCRFRAKGMTMQFKDGAGNFVSVKDPVTGQSTQTLTFTDAFEQNFELTKT